MSVRVQVVAVAASIGLLLIVLELIRRRKLQEEYSLFWLLMGGALLVLVLWKKLLFAAAELIGIAYPPSALFVIGFGLVLLILLHFSTVISELSAQNRDLYQRQSILTWRVEQLEDAEVDEEKPEDEHTCPEN